MTIFCRHCGQPVETNRWRLLGSTVCLTCAANGLADPTVDKILGLQVSEAKNSRLELTTTATPAMGDIREILRPRVMAFNGLYSVITHYQKKRRRRKPTLTEVKDNFNG